MARHITLVDAGLLSLFRALVLGQAAWPLFLHGRAGGGKTCAALALCDITISSYQDVESLCDRTMACPEEMPGVWQEIKERPVAVLDEIGCRERVTDLHYSVVKRFSEERERSGQIASIFVSNMSPDRLAELYDDRIASRLLAGTHFNLDSPDRRQQA